MCSCWVLAEHKHIEEWGTVICKDSDCENTSNNVEPLWKPVHCLAVSGDCRDLNQVDSSLAQTHKSDLDIVYEKRGGAASSSGMMHDSLDAPDPANITTTHPHRSCEGNSAMSGTRDNHGAVKVSAQLATEPAQQSLLRPPDCELDKAHHSGNSVQQGQGMVLLSEVTAHHGLE
jgi:hypothetical protein